MPALRLLVLFLLLLRLLAWLGEGQVLVEHAHVPTLGTVPYVGCTKSVR